MLLSDRSPWIFALVGGGAFTALLGLEVATEEGGLSPLQLLLEAVRGYFFRRPSIRRSQRCTSRSFGALWVATRKWCSASSSSPSS